MSEPTTFRAARQAWRAHRKVCPDCGPALAGREFCAEGARLYREMLNAPFESDLKAG